MNQVVLKINVRVNAITPRFIDCPMIKYVPKENNDIMLLNIKIGRIGQLEDAAEAVLFFASSMSGYIAGQVHCVDGGMRI